MGASYRRLVVSTQRSPFSIVLGARTGLTSGTTIPPTIRAQQPPF